MIIVTRHRLAFAAVSLGLALAAPASADLNDLLQMSEQLDRIEKQDFGDAIDKADACTRARDFACTDSWLAKAARLAGGSGDRQRLAAAQQGLVNEKARVAEEERQRAEEQRRIAEAEEKLRIAEAEAARRSSAASRPISPVLPSRTRRIRAASWSRTPARSLPAGVAAPRTPG